MVNRALPLALDEKITATPEKREKCTLVWEPRVERDDAIDSNLARIFLVEGVINRPQLWASRVVYSSNIAELLGGLGVHEETLDWDFVFELRQPPKRAVNVTLRYEGRGSPIPDPDPWT